ncbi:MAG: TerB family tellurite resistance protein [Saprospiraceae bacterium]|nr:TerB family tellurite resistance protein [Bacteroidia bacterium]NNE14843.1 TerB family tellurite resistance protein [Saprospiraceae bacterium]NNL90595.1 TerB family tellurite resistance protein [Saprospiraceae bacterium]
MASLDDKLYDAFGELVYALAISDGEVQEEEIQTLNALLEDHPWAKEIKWSFNYEKNKHRNINDVYNKVKFACFDLGPHPEYAKMLEVLEKVAESSLGVVEEEQQIIDKFKADLIEEFMKR